MNLKKKKLLTNLVSSFLILLCTCLFIALLINLKFNQDCATVITGMLGVCATLYAPIAAFFLYDSWKDQKQYELEKQYAEDTFKLISQLKTRISREYYTFKSFKSDISKELVALNSLYSNQNSNISYSEILYNANAYFELINDTSNNKISPNIYDDFEFSALILNAKLKDVRKAYDSYYKELPNELKTSTNTQRLYKNLTYNPTETEYELTKHLTNRYKFEINLYHEGNYINFEFNYEELYANFLLKYNDLKNELTNKIKVNKDH